MPFRASNMQGTEQFVNLLDERRRDCDIMWVSRPMQPVAPHKLPPECVFTRKQAIQAVLADPRVLSIIDAVAAAEQVSTATVLSKANAMLQEMASKSHLPTVRWLGLLITKVLKRILISIQLNESLLYRLKNQMSISQVQYVYAPTHRSYLDFVLLSYILFCYDMALPNIASGMDFYKMRIVGELLRNTGAFYMRRSFSTDSLYKEIFRAYVNSLVARSDRAIEFFIEGTRSRSQKTLSPKFGLLSSILEGLFRSNVPDIQFIPISISYDKPLEELLFAYEMLGVPKPAESTTGLFRSLSILREPFAHGHVYLKIAPPISAREYLDWATRKSSALSPQTKLPPQVTKNVAYAVIDCHKRNTILTPFNLISLLYNQKIISHSMESYSLHKLIQDYQWLKKILKDKFNAMVSSDLIADSRGNIDRNEVLESLQTHKNLIEIDSKQNLKLKSRHAGVTQLKGIKGHALSEQTLKVAVPAMNLMIYVNPVFAYLSKPAIAASCINSPTEEISAKRYLMLRSLFSIEFALATQSDSELLEEWKFMTEIVTESSIHHFNSDQIDSNTRLCSILRNLFVPFIESLFILCKTLLQWDNTVECMDTNIMKECQRRVEESMFQEVSLIKHPYSLSLDIYASLLSSLVTCGNVTLDKCGFYKPNRNNLDAVITDIEDILKQDSRGSYMDISSSLIPEETLNLQAKL